LPGAENAGENGSDKQMNGLSLLIVNLRRKPTRTGLTVATLVIAFLLFMLLRAIAAAFSGGVEVQGPQRLYIDARYSMTDNLPIAHLHAIRQLPDIRSVTPTLWFGGYYQVASNAFTKLVIDPEQYFDVFPEIQVSGEALDRFRGTRRSVLVSRILLDQYGWQVGDLVPIYGDIWQKADGTNDWQFEIAGGYSVQSGRQLQPAFLIHYEYFNESVMSWAQDMSTSLVARIADGTDPKTSIEAIDSLFENSSDPTRSQLEDDYARQFAHQLGDMGAITTLILIAVFFTIVLLTANVTSLSFRERVPELAVMKTLGFEDGFVATLVIAEAVLMCVLGAAGGIALALIVEPALNAQLAGVLGTFELRWTDALTALVLSAGIGLLIALPSAWAAKNLPIVDALREVH